MDLRGTLPIDTFQYLINIENGYLYNGTGSKIEELNITSSNVSGSSLISTNTLIMPYSSSTKIVNTEIQTGSMFIEITNNLLYVYNGLRWTSCSLS